MDYTLKAIRKAPLLSLSMTTPDLIASVLTAALFVGIVAMEMRGLGSAVAGRFVHGGARRR
jgi:hypothetical protein